MTPRELYNHLFTLEIGTAVRVPTGSKREHENLRVTLVKLHRPTKEIGVEEGLCASFDETSGVSSFWLGKRIRITKNYKLLDGESPEEEAPCESMNQSGTHCETSKQQQ